LPYHVHKTIAVHKRIKSQPQKGVTWHIFPMMFSVMLVVDAGEECGRNHSGSCGIEKVIAALSSNLSTGFKGTTKWSVSDTTAGLLKLYNRHAFEGAEDTIIGEEVRDR